jgi:hypothetical protein
MSKTSKILKSIAINAMVPSPVSLFGDDNNLKNKNMSKTYLKVHKLDKAAKNHIARIKKRGGKVEKTKGKKILLKYSFPK